MNNNSLSLVPVVLCGGSGTRLWPLSRKLLPKQFIPLADGCLFERTLSRLSGLDTKHTIVVCNEVHRFFTANSIAHLGIKACTIILEPMIRDTAAAIALAALRVVEQMDDGLLLVLPSDHLVKDTSVFQDSVVLAQAIATSGAFVTFGITPTNPDIAYGYIRKGEAVNESAYRVEQFHEKPDKDTACKWVEQGGYYWNSGMFLFSARRYLDALAQHAAKIHQACTQAYEKHVQNFDFITVDADIFANGPKLSVDYAIMEKVDNAVVIPVDMGWEDVGSWESLSSMFEGKEGSNVYQGEVVFHNAANNIAYAEKGLLAVSGLDDCIVVQTADVVLVSPRSNIKNIKQLVNLLSANGHKAVEEHNKVYRPWGFYQSIDVGDGFQVKRIMVNPSHHLSLQSHQHRSEHWVVVSGRAHVTHGEKKIILEVNQSIYIPAGTKHRLGNMGEEPLFLIEVQCGSYLGEDDIVRYEDGYGRSQ